MEEGKDEEDKIRNPLAYVAGLKIETWWDQQEEELAKHQADSQGGGGGRRQVNKPFSLALNFSLKAVCQPPQPNNTYDGEKAPANHSILSAPP
jgi:hypothetical protein